MEKPIGALWVSYTKNDSEYLSGHIEIDGIQHRIVAFPNRKKNNKSPDFNIYKAKPKEENKPF